MLWPLHLLLSSVLYLSRHLFMIIAVEYSRLAASPPFRLLHVLRRQSLWPPYDVRPRLKCPSFSRPQKHFQVAIYCDSSLVSLSPSWRWRGRVARSRELGASHWLGPTPAEMEIVPGCCEPAWPPQVGRCTKEISIQKNAALSSG